MATEIEVPTLKVGTPAPDIAFLGEGDREVRLSDLWREGPTILVFLRHFG